MSAVMSGHANCDVVLTVISFYSGGTSGRIIPSSHYVIVMSAVMLYHFICDVMLTVIRQLWCCVMLTVMLSCVNYECDIHVLVAVQLGEGGFPHCHTLPGGG